jgi:AcrR family transcriptional regulator
MRKVDPIKQQERRRHILNAAAHCFAEHGFHGTSTAQICERAGMSPGNLFHYYRSKADIIEALIAADTEATRDVIQAACASPDARAAARGWLAEQVLLYLDPSYVRLGMEVLAEAVRNPAVHALVIANEAERKQGLTAMLASAWGKARGETPPQPPDEMADMILLLLDGIFSRRVVDPGFDAKAGRRLIESALVRYLPSDTAAGGRK